MLEIHAVTKLDERFNVFKLSDFKGRVNIREVNIMKKLIISLFCVMSIAAACAVPVFAHHGAQSSSRDTSKGICPNNSTGGLCTHSEYCSHDGSCLVDGICTNKDCPLYEQKSPSIKNDNRTRHNGHCGHGGGGRNGGYGRHRR